MYMRIKYHDDDAQISSIANKRTNTQHTISLPFIFARDGYNVTKKKNRDSVQNWYWERVNDCFRKWYICENIVSFSPVNTFNSLFFSPCEANIGYTILVEKYKN